MLRIPLFFLCLALLSCCTLCNTAFAEREENNNVRDYYFDFSGKEINNQHIIEEVAKGSHAAKAGIKPGDILIAIDGNKVKSARDIRNITTTIFNDKEHSLSIRRNGNISNIKLKPKYHKVPPTLKAIADLATNEKRISIAVIVSQVMNNLQVISDDWIESMRLDLQSSKESELLSTFSTYDKFSIVDRSKLNHLLDEFRLNQEGLVSDKSSAKIGEMTGATHIMDISFTRFSGQTLDSSTDTINARLIDIQSGKVLAVDKSSAHY